METKQQFKTWAIVEVMGHTTYAGYVSEETIAGSAMLRIDVPEMEDRTAFTKYISPGALYGISPCTEETARARAASLKATPFPIWGMEHQIMDSLIKRGLMTRQEALLELEQAYGR